MLKRVFITPLEYLTISNDSMICHDNIYEHKIQYLIIAYKFFIQFI